MASIYVLGHHYQVAKNKHFHSLDKHDPIAAEKWRKEATTVYCANDEVPKTAKPGFMNPVFKTGM